MLCRNKNCESSIIPGHICLDRHLLCTITVSLFYLYLVTFQEEEEKGKEGETGEERKEEVQEQTAK